MPWAVSDVNRHKKGLTPAQKKKWVSIANSVLQDCLNKGISNSICEGRAIRIANSQSVKGEAVGEFYECEICSSSKFDRFEYMDRVNPNILIGLKKGTAGVQAFYYPKASFAESSWTEEQARKHCAGKGGTFEPAKKEQKGQGGGPAGTGGTDKCACPNPKCTEYKKPIAHKRGIPCNTIKCLKCKTPLTGIGTVGTKLKGK